ncbi:MAG: SpoIIE family protein phosphatase, partial [Thermoleophilia bacterium]
GHPSPVLLDGEGCHVLEPAGVGPVLGLLDEGEWPFTPFTLPPGATYVTYTDGLVEARAGEEVFGLERVCGILTAERNVAVEARLARLVAAARRFDDGSLRDDVVVMALERVPPVHV